MLIKRHPQQGARVVSSLDGYGPVAEIILAHHERIDGKGYPRGLAGDEIPELSRIISVADTYDVMTARDSYRTPMSSHDAIVELRRVAGKQLDARFVEVFIELLEGKDVSFQHGEAADFEKELALESRIAETASPERRSQPLPGRRRQRLNRRGPCGTVRPRMRAVTFQAPEQVRIEEKPDPEVGRRRRRGDPGRGERDLRLRPPHLPRAGAGRAGLHDRPRVRRHGAGGGRRRRAGGGRRPRARHLPHRLRDLRLLPARRLPPLPQRPDLRPRRQPRRPAGRPGRAAAGAARQPDPAPGAGGDVGRRRPLRRRRDGDRLPRRRPRRDALGRHGRGARASARSGSARCRPRSPAAPSRSSRSTRSRNGWRWPRPSGRRRCT